MADMDDLAQILQSLLSKPSNYEEKNHHSHQNIHTGHTHTNESQNNTDDGFDFSDMLGGIDFDMLMKMGELFSSMQRNDPNSDLLLALKSHMRDENKDKVDSAMRLLKIMNMLPYLKNSGIMENLF